MRKLILLPILALIAVGITSCSPEAKLEKRLDGDWTMSKMSFAFFVGGASQGSFNIPNAGTLMLDRKAGTGMLMLDYIFDGDTVKENMTVTSWSNTDAQVTLITKDSQNSIDTTVFVVKTNEKKMQVWENTTTETNGGVEEKSVLTLTLDKK